MEQKFSANLIKKYGPGFVAFSKKSGKVVAHAKEFGNLYKKIEKNKSFKENQLIISHIPGFTTRSAYSQKSCAYSQKSCAYYISI